MKLNKFSYLYSKPLGNHTLKITKKLPGNLLKNLEKSWKYHGILSVWKSGNPDNSMCSLTLLRIQKLVQVYYQRIASALLVIPFKKLKTILGFTKSDHGCFKTILHSLYILGSGVAKPFLCLFMNYFCPFSVTLLAVWHI